MDQESQVSVRSARFSLLVYKLRNFGFAIASVIVLIVVFTILNPRFMTYQNWYHISQQDAIITVLALGQTYVIATAGIDIAQGSVLALTAMLSSGSMVFYKWSSIAGVLVGLAAGIVSGLIIGYSITKLKVPPFIATLGMLAAAVGVALLYNDGEPIFGLPQGYVNIANTNFLFFPSMAWIMVALALIASFVLNRTTFGRYTLAVGSNIESARRAGINVDRHLLYVYVLSSFTSAIGGVLYASYAEAAIPTAGQNYELYSIAAVVIGGGSLFGGIGTILGSVLGALLMTILRNGTQLAGISPYVERVVLGLVVIFAVYFDNLRRKR
jgi:ribose transport system permease protein